MLVDAKSATPTTIPILSALVMSPELRSPSVYATAGRLKPTRRRSGCRGDEDGTSDKCGLAKQHRRQPLPTTSYRHRLS
jgi:hypothetical protein